MELDILFTYIYNFLGPNLSHYMFFKMAMTDRHFENCQIREVDEKIFLVLYGSKLITKQINRI